MNRYSSALNVKYRNFRHVVPFIVPFGLSISPVGFGSAFIPPDWRVLYSLNPMVGVIDGFRWALSTEKVPLYRPGILVSFIVVLLLLSTGITCFRKTEKTFVDII